jgi:hypothetical protein
MPYIGNGISPKSSSGPSKEYLGLVVSFGKGALHLLCWGLSFTTRSSEQLQKPTLWASPASNNLTREA